jgi:cell division protein FtsL
MTDESYMTEVDIIYEEIHRMEAEIAEKDSEIENLKKQLAALQS